MNKPMRAYATVWAGDDRIVSYTAARSRAKATGRVYQSVADAYRNPSWRFRTVRAPEFDTRAAELEHIDKGAIPIGWRDMSTGEAWGCAEQRGVTA